MTRDFAKQQLARIQSWWPSLPATSQAVNEFMRALTWATDAEIDGGVSDVIDSHAEGSAPKITHIKAAVKARRPKMYDSATEEERDLLFGAERQARERREGDELHRLEEWVNGSAEGKREYESIITDLLKDWPDERKTWGRGALHASVLRRAFEQTKKLRLA